MIHEIEFALSTIALIVMAVKAARELWAEVRNRMGWHEGARLYKAQQRSQQ